MNKTRTIQRLAGALLIAAALGCSQRTSTEELGGAYTAETHHLDNGITEYRVYRGTGQERRLVTEAIVEKGDVQTLLPTPVDWGREGQGCADSSYLATVFCGETGHWPALRYVHLDRDEAVTVNGGRRRTDMYQLEEIQRIGARVHMHTVVVVETELPIRFAYLHDVIAMVARTEDVVGLVLLPWNRGPIKPLSQIAPLEGGEKRIEPPAGADGIPPAQP